MYVYNFAYNLSPQVLVEIVVTSRATLCLLIVYNNFQIVMKTVTLSRCSILQ